jgi:hypothetical protein
MFFKNKKAFTCIPVPSLSTTLVKPYSTTISILHICARILKLNLFLKTGNIVFVLKAVILGKSALQKKLKF